MFDEREFVAEKQSRWQDLSTILERVKYQGLKGMASDDLARLGSVYRRAAADLAFVRTQNATSELVFYLNELVGQGHGILYQETKSRSLLSALRDFFAWELPDTLRRRAPFVFTAFAITVIGALIAYYIVHTNPANESLFVDPGMQSSVDAWKHGFADHDTISVGNGGMFSAFLMQHNISVGLVAFATGITTVLPALMMYQNGAMLGALIAVVQPTGFLTTMWAGLLPHGVWELGAIFVAGGAGLLIGWALISPGLLTRRDALLSNARDAVKMIMGTVPMLVIAGTLEGNVSHASLPHFLKFGVAAAEFAFIMFYVYGGWTRKPATSTR